MMTVQELARAVEVAARDGARAYVRSGAHYEVVISLQVVAGDTSRARADAVRKYVNNLIRREREALIQRERYPEQEG